MPDVFQDRREAGRQLAARLAAYAGRPEVIVLGLPRGGVPVAFEVARSLRARLDVYVVRKLGLPGHEEFALGAVATGGVRVLNADAIEALAISSHTIDQLVALELKEVERRNRLYRGERPAPELAGQIVILVDDGLATGATMRAASAAIRPQRPARLVVAVPTAAPETCAELASELDEVFALILPEPFVAVGLWYQDFEQVTDDEVRQLLTQAAAFAPRR